MAAYRAPFGPGRNRSPLTVSPAQILGARPWLARLETELAAWRGPAAFVWPDADIAFRARELARWQRLWPQARSATIARCGHCLWEAAPDEAAALLRGIL